MARPSFLQYLDMLRKCGRVRTSELSPEPLKAAEDWMATQRALWERRLDQLDNFLTELKGSE